MSIGVIASLTPAPEPVIVADYHMHKSLWRTPEGITIGTSLKQLERLNGRPFLLL